MTPKEPLRAQPLALAAVGDPASPETWSGISVGILAGLRELGLATRAIDVTPPRPLTQALLAAASVPTGNRYDAEGAALTARLRGLIARARLRGTDVAGAIQLSSTFALPPGIRYVTLEDMTLAQAVRDHPVFSRMSPRAIASWERRRREVYAHARVCAVASHWAADSLYTDYGLARARVAVVGFGANHVMDAAERDWSVPRFLFVGIDWERKGGPPLLHAFARVRELHPSATLDVVGGHPPLSEPGVTGHGVLSQASARDRGELAALYARATCFVMPSLVEPFGIAYVEAGFAGVPSIGGSVGGAPEVIGKDGGVVVDAREEGSLLEAMLQLADPQAAQRMGAAARERARLYTWQKVAERLLRALALPAPDGRELAAFL